MQRTREAASPVGRTGGAVGGAAADTGGHLLAEAHYAQTLLTVWSSKERIKETMAGISFAAALTVIEQDFHSFSMRFVSAVLKPF